MIAAAAAILPCPSQVLSGFTRLVGVNRSESLACLREELTTVLGALSSNAVLPQIMRKLELTGVKSSVVGLLVPTS